MTIDWIHFTPYHAALGGVVIGVSVSLLLLMNGRIAGISGIIGGLLRAPVAGDRAWRLAFIGGLIAAPLLYRLFAELPASRIDASLPILILAGLLVGFGTSLGSGCTSGHSVCGLSRLSLRSLAATLTFMATGFITVFVVRHLLA